MQRLAYWVVLMIVGGLWGRPCGMGVSRLLDVEQRPWLAIGAMTLIITGPLSVVVWAATGLFFYREFYR